MSDLMNLKVEIKRVSDGLVATYINENWDYNQYWWEEGNASCDCNREDFFMETLGLPEIPCEESICSDGRFLVRLTNNDTGEVLYDEWERE